MGRRFEVDGVNRRRADVVVGVIVVAVLVIGGILSWQAFQQQRAFAQMMPMMGSSMGTVHRTNPLWYVVGTLTVAAVVGGVYLTVRQDLPVRKSTEHQSSAALEPNPSTSKPAPNGTGSADDVDPATQSRSRVLDLLPEDERRVLEPVLTSPGITQIELRDRSDFSKSKVSQTVSDLEKRGLLTRERQGRTYRIYPTDDLRDNQS